MNRAGFTRFFASRDPFLPIEAAGDLNQMGRMGPLIAFSAGFRFLFYLGCSYLLTLIIDPEEFGRLLQVSVPLALVMLFGDLGVGDGVIRLKKLQPRLSSLFFYINICLSTAAAVLLIAVIPVFEIWFNGVKLMDLGMVAALSLATGGLIGQHRALLRRQLRYKTLSVLEIVTAVVANGSAVLLALADVGIIAIPLGRSIANLVQFILMAVVTGWFPGRSAGFSEARSTLAFGFKLAGSGVIHFGSVAVASMMIGRVFPEDTLGYLERASALSKGLVGRVRGLVSLLGFSILSRSRHFDQGRFDSILTLFFKTACVVTVIPIAAMGALSEPLVPVFLGQEWIEMGAFMRLEWWALMPIFPITFVLNGLLAEGHSGTLVKWNVVRLVIGLVVLSILVIGREDMIGYLAVVAGVAIVDAVVFTAAVSRILKIRTSTLVGPLVLSLLAGIGAAASICFLTSHFHLGVPVGVSLLLTLACVSYPILSRKKLKAAIESSNSEHSDRRSAESAQ